MQVLFQFKSIIWLISSISLKHFKYDVKHFLTKKQWQSTIVYLLISTMTTFMLAWNWKLICAILIGIILMLGSTDLSTAEGINTFFGKASPIALLTVLYGLIVKLVCSAWAASMMQ